MLSGMSGPSTTKNNSAVAEEVAKDWNTLSTGCA